MKTIKRRLAAAIFMALALFLSIASGLAAPGESPFAEFRIDASGMDVSDREISVDIYRRDDGGQFQKTAASNTPAASTGSPATQACLSRPAGRAYG